MDLDHVAIATTDARTAHKTLIGEWGAVDLWGGLGVGFRPMQLQVGADGMRLEMLEPWATETFDFLARFIDKHGDGPHHITFKVPDLVAEIDRLAELGYQLVNVNLSSPHWKEAFFMPKDAHGTVVQVAQAAFDHDHDDPEVHEHHERWWDPTPPRAPSTVTLRRVVLATNDLDATGTFFATVLRGSLEAYGSGWRDFVWPGGGRVRVEQRTDRGPGIDRLECESTSAKGDFVVAGTTFRLL